MPWSSSFAHVELVTFVSNLSKSRFDNFALENTTQFCWWKQQLRLAIFWRGFSNWDLKLWLVKPNFTSNLKVVDRFRIYGKLSLCSQAPRIRQIRFKCKDKTTKILSKQCPCRHTTTREFPGRIIDRSQFFSGFRDINFSGKWKSLWQRAAASFWRTKNIPHFWDSTRYSCP